MPYYNPYSRQARGRYTPRRPYQPFTPTPQQTTPTPQQTTPSPTQPLTGLPWKSGYYRPYNPYGYQPTYNPLRTSGIGGAYTLPGRNTYGEPYYRVQQPRYTGAPRVTRGANMASRPSPYQPSYQPPYQPPYQQPYGGQSMSLNQIKDIFTLAQNMGASPAMMQAYLQERASNPYGMNIADFLQWWARAKSFGSPYLPTAEEPYSYLPMGGG